MAHTSAGLTPMQLIEQLMQSMNTPPTAASGLVPTHITHRGLLDHVLVTDEIDAWTYHRRRPFIAPHKIITTYQQRLGAQLHFLVWRNSGSGLRYFVLCVTWVPVSVPSYAQRYINDLYTCFSAYVMWMCRRLESQVIVTNSQYLDSFC